jgi:DNA-directed RNA polymerase sigma subunit (sigma70/sigma32)
MKESSCLAVRTVDQTTAVRILNHLGLIRYFVSKYPRWAGLRRWAADRGMSGKDFRAEGILGLVRAAIRFDPAKGDFISYACPAMRRAIVKSIAAHWIHHSTTVNDGREFEIESRPLPDPDASFDVQALLGHLSTFHREFVERHFGLNGREETSIHKLARHHRIRVEEARRILARAMAGLQRSVGTRF